MSDRYQEMVFSATNYENNESMWSDISSQIQTLLKNRYNVVIRDDDGSGEIVVLEYEHDNRFDDWGGVRPVWVDYNTYENIITQEDEE